MQNGVTSSIKPQQITYIVPGIENFDHTGISDFIQKAQDNLVGSCLWNYSIKFVIFYLVVFVKDKKSVFTDLMQDPALLEFAWVELLENNKSVTTEELAEVLNFYLGVQFLNHCSTMTIDYTADDFW